MEYVHKLITDFCFMTSVTFFLFRVVKGVGHTYSTALYGPMYGPNYDGAYVLSKFKGVIFNIVKGEKRVKIVTEVERDKTK